MDSSGRGLILWSIASNIVYATLTNISSKEVISRGKTR